MRVIDLSVSISEKVKEPLPTKIAYETHEECADNVGKILFKDLEGDIFMNNMGLAGEVINLATHSGTHVDAPYHYSPTCDGKPSRTIDELPLEWFFSDGVVLDFTDKPEGYLIEPEDLIETLKKNVVKLTQKENHFRK